MSPACKIIVLLVAAAILNLRPMNRYLLVVIFQLLFPLFCVAELLPGFQEDLIVYGLNRPVAVEYTPDGRLFIVEKGGTIHVFKNGALLRKPLLRLPVNDIVERGLLGLALDPDFSNNQYIYIYRTTSANEPKNRVERYTVTGDIISRSSRKILLSGIRSDTGAHNAGDLQFGPDGKLYISTGDGGIDGTTAQDLTGLNGKILRINSDGSIPGDNPFVGRPDARPEIWCYGLRNPWRFAVHPKTGTVAIGDVGSTLYEEINIGRPGLNYGWPQAEGDSTNSNFNNPIYKYDHAQDRKDSAINGGFFYTAKKFPSVYRDRLFITDYVRGFIRTLTLDQNNNVLAVEEFASEIDSPVHMIQSPDGGLVYVSIGAGEIRKIRYVGDKNRPPIAVAEVSKDSGKVPLTVNFTSKGTKDPDEDPINYLWDFGDHTTSTLPNPQHTYATKGVYFALLTVRDDKKGVGYSKSMKITVGNEPPTASILKPPNGLVVRPGDTVEFTGKGTDPEDGALNPRFLSWNTVLHHNKHTHPFFEEVKGRKGSFVVPPTTDVGTLFYRLELEVVDSSGVRSRSTVDLTLKP
jgi:glucose/arabinose dehydrogenase